MASFLEDSSKIVTEMRNNLACQVCGDHAKPGQWYRCLNLHSICHECKDQNERCSCGQPISLEHCKLTEQLLSVQGLKFNCANTKHGCREVLAQNALAEHQSECIYRLVPCPMIALDEFECNDKVTFQDVLRHFEACCWKEPPTIDLFKICTGTIEQEYIDGEDWYDDPVKCTFNDQTFLLLEKMKEKVLYMWVYMLGSRNEAKHFSYTSKLFGPKSEISFKGEVAAIDEPFESLYKDGKCFAIPHSAYLAQLMNEDREFKWSLEIRNLKEEAKDYNYESGISDNE